MSKKLINVLIISLMFLLISTGFGIAKGETIKVGLDSGIPTLDWQSTTSFPVPHISAPVFEGLFAWGEDFKPKPELVDTWKHSEDLQTWTFSLREGIVFHNGEELKAEDVIASINRWREISPRTSELKNLESMEKVDEYTIEMNFANPIGDALLYTFADDSAKLVIMPKQIAEESTSGNLTEIIGTGPFYFEEYRADNYLLIKKFEDYVPRKEEPDFMAGRKEAMVEEVRFEILPEEFSRLSSLKNGEIDIALRISDTNYSDIEENEDLKTLVRRYGRGIVAYFNHKQGIMSDINMRKAFISAIDSKFVLDNVKSNENFYSIHGGIFPPDTAFDNDAGLEYYNQNDPEMVKEYLNEANYDGEEEITILSLQEVDSHFRTDVAVMDQLIDVGIQVDFRTHDTASWVDNRSNPEVMDVFITQTVVMAPNGWATTLTGNYPGWYQSDKLDEVFSKVQTASLEEMEELAKEMQRIIYEDVAIYPIGYHKQMFAANKNVIDEYDSLKGPDYPLLYNVDLQE